MTYDTFESLKVGNRLKRVGQVRTYPVVRIGTFRSTPDGVRVVYVCLNPTAVEKKGENPTEFGIFYSKDLDRKSHYLNWDKVS